MSWKDIFTVIIILVIIIIVIMGIDIDIDIDMDLDIIIIVIISIIVVFIVMIGLPKERLQQGNREVGEHEGGILVGSQQAPPQQQLGILSSKGNLLQLQPFVAVAAAYCHHLQQSPHAGFRCMQRSMLIFAC